MCPANREARLNREEYWIKTVRTSYPYGLNKRKRKPDPDLASTWMFIFPLFQGQDKDLSDVEMTSVLTTLKTWNPYLTVFITILLMIFKMHSTIYKYL